MKRKIKFLVTVIIFLFVLFFIFYQLMCKNSKNVHTNNSQEVVNNILNISSYEAIIEVKIEGNKNQNSYKIKQKYVAPDSNEQEILEPENIEGIRIIREGDKLILENSNLNLKSIIEDYNYISENKLDLSSFIKDYKEDKKAKFIEKDEIILETNNKEKKTLYIDKNEGKPTKMVVEDNIKNNKVYILYNEVRIK